MIKKLFLENFNDLRASISEILYNKKYRDYYFCLRFTLNPQNDIKRGWSAYMGMWNKNLKYLTKNFKNDIRDANEEFFEDFMEYMLDDKEDEINNHWEDYFDDEDDFYNALNKVQKGYRNDEINEIIEDIFDNDDKIVSDFMIRMGYIKYDNISKMYAVFHHDGLSVWGLKQVNDYSLVDDVFRDIKKMENMVRWEGRGDMTEGKIIYVGCINENKKLHLFLSKNISKE